MWIFLVTEIMFFGGLFLAYTIYRKEFAGVFAVASNTLDVVIGAANTAVLICSSFTMVLAVRAAQIGKPQSADLFLILTILFGGVFLGVKAYEWNEKFEEHHVPGPTFHLEGTTQQGPAQLFFSLYFAMTGLHALHMVIGEGLMLFLLWEAYRGKYTASLLHAGGYRRPLLALRRYHLDFPVSAAVSDCAAPTLTCTNTSIRSRLTPWYSSLCWSLTAATTVVATIDLGPFNVVMALFIAVVKMMLVALFFMHLRHSTILMKVVVGGGMLWLAILLVF